MGGTDDARTHLLPHSNLTGDPVHQRMGGGDALAGVAAAVLGGVLERAVRVEAQDGFAAEQVERLAEVGGHGQLGALGEVLEVVRDRRIAVEPRPVQPLQCFLDGKVRDHRGVREEVAVQQMRGRAEIALGLAEPLVRGKIVAWAGGHPDGLLKS